MDLSKIEELIALMRQAGLTQLSLELPDYKVSITRGAEPPATPDPPDTGQPVAAVWVPADLPLRPSGTGESVVATPVTVISPVVGIFRNGGGSPGRQMIAPGVRIRRGQLLAAIEAMKVPNEVRSPVEGVVTAVAVEDGSAVEYGQTLFLILPGEGGEADESETPIGMV